MQIVARGTLLTYPDSNETFKVHMNACAFPLGEVIRKKGKPIAFYIRKLSHAQQRSKVTEK